MKFIYTMILLAVILPNVVLAAGSFRDAGARLDTLGDQTGVGDQDLPTVVGTAINIALSMVGLIFLVIMVYAGLLWMTAQGENEKVEKARKMIIAAVIGLTVVMSASGITYLITSRFEASPPPSLPADEAGEDE